MSDKILYLLIDVCVVAVPLAASFYPKAPFYKEWRNAGIGLLITAIFFLVWDEVFTRLGIWSFNKRYLTGIFLGSLPIEEVLFFFCVPYACLFTYFALNRLIEKDYLSRHQRWITIALIVVLAITGLHFYDKLYTSSVCLLLSSVLLFQLLTTTSAYMGRFYFAFLVLLLPFFIVNGILTGSFIEEPVVRYNNEHNLGIRLGTIPVEDAVYSMLMMIMPIGIWERLKGAKGAKGPSAVNR